MFIMGRIVKSGGRIHNRNERHRAMVNAINCTRIIIEINRQSSNVENTAIGTAFCFLNNVEESK